jgi:hypothetical protein
MSTQLAAYLVDKDGMLAVRDRRFEVEGISSDADIHVATFRGPRACYTGIVCSNTTVPSRPGAEVWDVLDGRGRTVASFAIWQGTLLPLG